MSDVGCIHGIAIGDCATCRPANTRTAARSVADRTGHNKLLIFCLLITDDSLLHFNQQGESYRLRAYVGRLAGRRAWTQADAPTSTDFFRIYNIEQQIDIKSEQLSVDRADRWAEIITAQNRRLGIHT